MKKLLKIIAWPFVFIFGNLYARLSFIGLLFFSFLSHRKANKGENYVVEKEFKVHALTYWNRPFTGGFQAVLSKETILEVSDESKLLSPYFSCRVINWDNFERKYIGEDTDYEGYAGYRLLVPNIYIGWKIKKIN